MARRIPFLRLFPGAAAICSLALFALVAHADDLKLKDGSIVQGTIVGFDDDSFKVQTSYGFALVRKDQVVSISMANAAKAAAPENKGETGAGKKPSSEKPKPEISAAATAPGSVSVPASAPAASSAATGEIAATPNASLSPKTEIPTTATAKAPRPAAASLAAKANAQPPVADSALPGVAPTTKPPIDRIAPPALTPVAAATASSAAPVAVAAPPKPSAPEPIRETVSGNTYTNKTYRFQMYKPPDWQVLGAERTVLPGAIAALGTDDQETYLLIGQEPAGKSLNLAADAADKRLRDILENFRPQGKEQLLVAGVWVTAQHFRGTVDDQEWSGVVVLVPHGTSLYTIFGMTRADNDLVQIQENVMARAIASLQFTDP